MLEQEGLFVHCNVLRWNTAGWRLLTVLVLSKVTEWAWVQLHFIWVCATNWRMLINFTFFPPVPWRRWSLWGLRFMWFVWANLYSWLCHATVGCLVPDFLQPKISYVKSHVTILAERCNNSVGVKAIWWMWDYVLRGWGLFLFHASADSTQCVCDWMLWFLFFFLSLLCIRCIFS